jgi:ABC-type branched-subunit amino acid transport system ATPase component
MTSATSSPPVEAAIEVTGLCKTYGSHVAVDDVSFTVRRGTVTGFLGPNGAGKSTTLRMLEAVRRVRQSPLFFDLTPSLSKSILIFRDSLLDAS